MVSLPLSRSPSPPLTHTHAERRKQLAQQPSVPPHFAKRGPQTASDIISGTLTVELPLPPANPAVCVCNVLAWLSGWVLRHPVLFREGSARRQREAKGETGGMEASCVFRFSVLFTTRSYRRLIILQ